MMDRTSEASYHKHYSRIKHRKEQIEPHPVWAPWGRWHNQVLKLEGKLVFDFGSGKESPFYQKFLSQNGGNDSNYKAYDIDEDTVEWLEERTYFCDFHSDSSLIGRFDVINASQVYEHLSPAQREAFLNRSYELLKPKGILLVDVPYIANLNVIEFFKRDRSHMPVALEDEAAYIESLGFSVIVYIGGLTVPYRGTAWNLWRAFTNLILGYYPFNVTLFHATKINT